MVFPKEDNKFLVVVKLFLVTNTTLSKFTRLLRETGFTSRIPHDTERKQGEPLFIKFMLSGRTVEKDFTLLVECLVQSGLLKTVLVCEMDKY